MTYYCHECRRHVMVDDNMECADCHGGFIEEMSQNERPEVEEIPFQGFTSPLFSGLHGAVPFPASPALNALLNNLINQRNPPPQPTTSNQQQQMPNQQREPSRQGPVPQEDPLQGFIGQLLGNLFGSIPGEGEIHIQFGEGPSGSRTQRDRSSSDPSHGNVSRVTPLPEFSQSLPFIPGTGLRRVRVVSVGETGFEPPRPEPANLVYLGAHVTRIDEQLEHNLNRLLRVLHANLGDYAWGEGGLDQIVTTLLNQFDPNAASRGISKDDMNNLPMSKVTEKQVENGTQCTTCMDTFNLNEEVAMLDCKHIFHRPCIEPWLEGHNTCPICRQEMDPSKWPKNEQPERKVIDIDELD